MDHNQAGAIRRVAIKRLILMAVISLHLGCSPTVNQPVGVTLEYAIVSEEKQANLSVDAEAIVAALDKRINDREWLGEVTAVDEKTIRIGVYGKDPGKVQRVKQLVIANGSLEFVIAANMIDHERIVKLAEKSDDDTLVEEGRPIAHWVNVRPGDWQTMVASKGDLIKRVKDDTQGQVLVVYGVVRVTGTDVESAYAAADVNDAPCMGFQMTERGARAMRALTSRNLPDYDLGVTRRLAIVLDDELRSAPFLEGTIGERGQVTGSFTREEVGIMVSIVRAGGLPPGVQLKLVKQKDTSP